MTDETLPPVRKPNTPRNAIAWLMAHPEWSVPIATFLLGLAMGAWL